MEAQIVTTNPYTQKSLQTYAYFSQEKVDHVVNTANATFLEWQTIPVEERSQYLNTLANILKNESETLSIRITEEMGKPITESRAEIEKCIQLCKYYRDNASQQLGTVHVDTVAKESFVRHDPIGVILGIMPWNFPFWQVFRFAIPTLTAGNTVLIKHAENVTGCALEMQRIFEHAGYPKGCFTTLIASHETTETLIKNDAIKGVSLTGSETAGKTVAAIAGAHLKPSLLELGGNNACIVLADADLDAHLETMVKARMQNAGQSCIAAKRFIVEEKIYDTFLEQFTAKVAALQIGDPLQSTTEIGVLARPDLAEGLHKQIETSLQMGAKVHYGNAYKNTYYQPTILTNVTPEMPVFTEETFGPVAAILKVPDVDTAYKLSQQSRFGLGTMVFTQNTIEAKHKITAIADGAFFINAMVKSDVKLPFGGTKASGYGRELAKEGLLAFTNAKTVYINT